MLFHLVFLLPSPVQQTRASRFAPTLHPRFISLRAALQFGALKVSTLAVIAQLRGECLFPCRCASLSSVLRGQSFGICFGIANIARPMRGIECELHGRSIAVHHDATFRA
jgi:hypothetical protein